MTTVSQLLAVAAAVATAQKRTSRDLPLSPRFKSRDVVATLGDARCFGRLLVARVWKLGMFQSERKSFVADGGAWLWKLFQAEFEPFWHLGHHPCRDACVRSSDGGPRAF